MSPCSIATLTVLAATGLPAAGEGLVARWAFDEGGGSLVRDAVGESHGRLHGCTFEPCGEGYALRLDGVSDYVDFGDPPALAPTDAFALEAWVYPEAAPAAGEAGIIGKTYGDYVLTYYTDGKCYWYGGSGGRHASGNLTLGAWHHVVATFGDDALRLYIDGELIASARNDQPVLRNSVAFAMGTSLGGDEFTKGAHFRGMLDDVSVYRRALTADEVKRRYVSTHLTGQPSITAEPSYGTREILVHVGLRLGRIEPEQCGDPGRAHRDHGAAGDRNGTGVDHRRERRCGDQRRRGRAGRLRPHGAGSWARGQAGWAAGLAHGDLARVAAVAHR